MAGAGATTGAPVAIVATNPKQKLQNFRAGCPDNDPLCPWGKDVPPYLLRATVTFELRAAGESQERLAREGPGVSEEGRRGDGR